MNGIMEKAHPIFRLANNGWKLHHLAISSYPSWRRNHIENAGANENSKKRKQSASSESIKSEVNEKKIKGMNLTYPINVADFLQLILWRLLQ